MAEPIRKVAPSTYHRHPHGARPRPVPWVEEPKPGPRPTAAPEPASRPSGPVSQPVSQPVSNTPESLPPTLAEPGRSFPPVPPVPEKKLRTFLQTALALHAAALLLPFLFPSAFAASGLSGPVAPSDLLLGAAVLLAGGAALALGASARRGSPRG